MLRFAKSISSLVSNTAARNSSSSSARGITTSTLSKPKRFASLPTLQQVRHATTSDTGAFLPDPEKARMGLTGVTATVSIGLILGATSAKNIATFLEENELFVPSDDDDDD